MLGRVIPIDRRPRGWRRWLLAGAYDNSPAAIRRLVDRVPFVAFRPGGK